MNDVLAVQPRSDRRIELKFLIDPELADRLREWARDHLDIDPHTERSGANRDSYRISTLYLDTAELDLFHRCGEVGISKHRVRRYGEGSEIWLETKRKRKVVVKKRRVAIRPADWQRVPRSPDGQESRVESWTASAPSSISTTAVVMTDSAIAHSTESATNSELQTSPAPLPWPGDWFEARVSSRRLAPAAMIHYRRFARIGTAEDDAFRLTIDHDLRGQLCDQWRLPEWSAAAAPLSTDRELLELKFTRTMPSVFKDLLHHFPLVATGFSKYRTCMNHFLEL